MYSHTRNNALRGGNPAECLFTPGRRLGAGGEKAVWQRVGVAAPDHKPHLWRGPHLLRPHLVRREQQTRSFSLKSKGFELHIFKTCTGEEPPKHLALNSRAQDPQRYDLRTGLASTDSPSCGAQRRSTDGRAPGAWVWKTHVCWSWSAGVS